jgi:hypothetical protein
MFSEAEQSSVMQEEVVRHAGLVRQASEGDHHGPGKECLRTCLFSNFGCAILLVMGPFAKNITGQFVNHY